ncbi:endonuclease/exonuclease/phosphatase family protein [Herbidospora sp. RD11066]
MIRIVRRTAVAVAAVWLVVTLVNWLSGDFWWWGGGAPLVVFFAVPLLVVAAVPMLALRRRVPSWPDRAVVSLAASALVLIAARWAFSGRTWLWVVPDLVIPPLLFLATPLLLLAAVPFTATTRWWTAGLAAAALALGATQAGVYFGGGGGPVPAGAVRVVSWDTYCWNTDNDPGHFYRYLKERKADLYLLQEHSGCGPGAPTSIDDADVLRREFPGYQIVALDGLLTVSRFPVAAQKAVGEALNPYAPNWRHAALRTDLTLGGRTVSVYNVHLFDMLYLSASPLSPRFYQAIETLDAGRKVQFDALAADIAANANPILASGNFNALPGMGHLRAMDGLTAAEGPRYPATLSFAGLRLWRMDWTFTSPDLAVHHYDVRSPDGLSTHHLQELLISEA